MIGKAIIGNSFNACVSYCLNKKKNPKIIDSNGVFGKSIPEISRQFNLIGNQRANLKKAVWHTPISFAHTDKINQKMMVEIARDYLKEMNLDDHQYLMVQHFDTQHSHLHIIINRVGFDGEVARDWKSGYRTKLVMQKLEKKYKLTIAVEQGNKRKEAIAEQIKMGLSKKEKLNQIFDRVENLGYQIQYNKTSTGNIRGVNFIDKDKGICFKSSSIKREYSYSKLVMATAQIKNFTKSKNLSL